MKRYVAVFIIVAFFCLSVGSQAPKEYKVLMDEGSRVYDGDTIQDVYIELYEFPGVPLTKVLFPGILLKDGTLYYVQDIRISGIDTPEKRPRKAGRTEESRIREKEAAAKAQVELDQLLFEKKFIIQNVESGKYSGRVVADVIVEDNENRINVGEYMISKGHAYPYDGGTKRDFDEWYQKK